MNKEFTLEAFINWCDDMMIVLESEEYETKLNRKDIIKLLKWFSRKYDTKDWYVSFKAALVLYGVEKETNDVDLCGTPALCKELVRKGFTTVSALYDSYRITITDRIEMFDDKDFHHTKFNNIEGINVATLDDIESFYKKMNRDKDQETLRKIKEYKSKRRG
jgi:hypothetical protein